MSKSQVLPTRIAASQSLGASFNTIGVGMLYQDRACFTVNLTSGAVTGNFSVQGRASFAPPATGAPNWPYSTGPTTEWCDLLNNSQSAPSVSGTSILFDNVVTACTELRIAYTRTAGSGTCDIWFSAKRSG